MPQPKNAQIIDIRNNSFETKRQHRWLFSVGSERWYWARTASRPSVTIEPITIDYINGRRYEAGKLEWGTLDVTLYDPIAPSASQKIMEWVRLCHENLSGRSGYAAFFKKNVNLELLDPVGVPIESWKIEGAWITDASFGDLDYATADPVDISITLRMDMCILEY